MGDNKALVAFGILFGNFTGFLGSQQAGRYLENVTPKSCLEDLSEALKANSNSYENLEDIFNMFSAVGSTGSRYWDQESFAKFLKAKHPNNPALGSNALLLWRCFSYHANIPFSQLSATSSTEIERPFVDFRAFQRAVALLVLKGVDLLGSSRHGDLILPRSQYGRYLDNRPRLAKLIFNSLGVPTKQFQLREEVSSDASLDLYARSEQEIFDTLILTQPCSVTGSPSESETRIHAERLLGLVDPTTSLPCRALQRNDLEAVIQLLLQVRVSEQRWVHDTWPPSEDVHHVYLVSDSAEIARAAKLASVLMKQFPRNGDSIDWPTFRDICTSSIVSPPLRASYYY
jgi:hypothetical protein